MAGMQNTCALSLPTTTPTCMSYRSCAATSEANVQIAVIAYVLRTRHSLKRGPLRRERLTATFANVKDLQGLLHPDDRGGRQPPT
jgi:hypothetical protein